MTTYPIVRTHMTPGLSNDCGVEGCNGISGGFCSLLQDNSGLAIKSWCCTPTALQCWGPRQSNCDVKAQGQTVCTSRAGSSTEWKWCCDNRFEECGASDGLCALTASPNPASIGPAWPSTSTFVTSVSGSTSAAGFGSGSASTSATSTSTSTSRQPDSTPESSSIHHPSNVIIGLGAASVVVLFAIGAGLFYLWRLNKLEKRKAAPDPAEMLTRFLSLEKERSELAGEDVSEVHELDTGAPLAKAE